MKKMLQKLLASVAFAGALMASANLSLAQIANPPPALQAYGPPSALYPYTGGLTGSYTMTGVTGTMAAGLAANSPIWAFRYTGTGVAVVKSIRFSAADTATAFAAGLAQFNFFVARAFTASDTGGTAATLTGNNGKLRTSFATTGVGQFMTATTGTMTAGTRTLDAQPIAAISLGVQAAAGVQLSDGSPSLIVFPQNAGDYPLVLAANEGIELQATVPATGTWSGSITIVWDEYASY